MWRAKRDNIRATSKGMRGKSSASWTTSAAGIVIAVAGLACVPLICRGEEAIGTTNGTYVLTDTNSLTTPSARQAADRTAQLALAGVTEDAAGYEKELKDVEEKITAHNAALDQLNKDLSDYRTRLSAYNAKLEPHNAQVAKYNAEVVDQREQVAQSNNLPPRKRNQTTVNRLNKWKAQLDQRKTELNREKGELDAQKAAMDAKALALNGRSQTINDEAQQLNADKAAIKVKLGEAYRQLKLCYDYSVQLQEMLSKDGIAASSDDRQTLSSTATTLERLKAVSNEGSINSAEKASLNSAGGQTSATGTPQE
jgi:chromosome segregation ATPase